MKRTVRSVSLLMIAIGAMGISRQAFAQWVVEDPGNLHQDIIRYAVQAQQFATQVMQYENEYITAMTAIRDARSNPIAALQSGALNLAGGDTTSNAVASSLLSMDASATDLYQHTKDMPAMLNEAQQFSEQTGQSLHSNLDAFQQALRAEQASEDQSQGIKSAIDAQNQLAATTARGILTLAELNHLQQVDKLANEKQRETSRQQDAAGVQGLHTMKTDTAGQTLCNGNQYCNTQGIFTTGASH